MDNGGKIMVSAQMVGDSLRIMGNGSVTLLSNSSLSLSGAGFIMVPLLSIAAGASLGGNGGTFDLRSIRAIPPTYNVVQHYYGITAICRDGCDDVHGSMPHSYSFSSQPPKDPKMTHKK